MGTTTVWTYDDAGNILTRKEYAYTTGDVGEETDSVTYTYGNSNWGDQLTSYDGQTISYDKIGNPEQIGEWEYSWKHGRELESMTNGTSTWEHTYNADGLRTKRTDGTDTYDYVYLDGQLVQLTVNDNGTEVLMKFTYDADGVPLSITYKGTTYYYVTNLQGDVVGIVNQSGNVVVSYTYDAWGNILSTDGSYKNSLGKYNPLRYRGYVYDEETDLYYLQSRYYDPEMGRFINADAFASTGCGLLGFNMFAYCNNNPVNTVDSSGNYPIEVGEDHRRGNIYFSKKYTNRPDSGLVGVPDAEIQRKARDKSLTGKERKRYVEEEKRRGLRNKQKRNSNFTIDRVGEVMLGAGIVVTATVGIAYVIVNDVTGVGTIDDLLLPSLGAGIKTGLIMIFPQICAGGTG